MDSRTTRMDRRDVKYSRVALSSPHFFSSSFSLFDFAPLVPSTNFPQAFAGTDAVAAVAVAVAASVEAVAVAGTTVKQLPGSTKNTVRIRILRSVRSVLFTDRQSPLSSFSRYSLFVSPRSHKKGGDLTASIALSSLLRRSITLDCLLSYSLSSFLRI